MYNMDFTHASFINTHRLQMFSCVQEPPAPPSLWEVLWHGKTVGPTREETTVCIKGVPGDFFASQPEAKDSDKALCLMDSVKLFDARQNHHPDGPCSTVQHPPVEDDAFSVNHSSTTNNETAKCQKAVTNLFNRPHCHSCVDNTSLGRLNLPLKDSFLDGWWNLIASECHPDLAEELIKYWQAETTKLLNSNVMEVDIFYGLGGCNFLDPETQKYIKCTVFTSVNESGLGKLQHLDHPPADETPD